MGIIAQHWRQQFTLAFLVAGLAFGCGSGPEQPSERSSDSGLDTGIVVDSDAGLPEDPPSISKLRALQNPSNALSFFVEWSTSDPTFTRLHVECGEEWSQTYRESALRSSHRVFVMGLWSGAECSAQAVSTAQSGETASTSTTFTAGPLPDFMPELAVRIRKPGAIQEGWTLANFTNRFDRIPLVVAIFDSRGRFRWYHQVSSSNPGDDTDVRVFRDGVLIGGNRSGVQPRQVNWRGDLVWKDSYYMHHELHPSSDGERLFYVTNASNCPNLEHDSNAIVEYDWREKREIERWKFCDLYTPDEDRPGWDHLNTVEPFPGERAVLTSARTQHAIFKVDLEEDEIVWKMGIDGDFGLSGDERFFRQHAPEIQPNGNIVMFDNGSLPRGTYSRPWSRAIEISYDVQSKHAEIVWSYRPDPDLFAPIWGDADRLDNGNTQVTFGVRNNRPDKNSRIVEVTPKGEEVWQVEAPNKWGWYRSQRVADRPTGTVLPE